MANLPCPPSWVVGGDEFLPPYTTAYMPTECCNPYCEEQAVDQHHAVRRSFLGKAYPIVRIQPEGFPLEHPMGNLIPVCRPCHDLLERNEHCIVLNTEGVLHDPSLWGWAWSSNPDGELAEPLNPTPTLLVMKVPGEVPREPDGKWTPPEEHKEEHEELKPGETCDKCGHRKPFPRKKGSPTSKPYPVQVPTDEYDTFKEVLTAAAAHAGVADMPFFAYKVLTIALAMVLQDESIKDYGKRV